MPITQEDIERYIGRQIIEQLDLLKRLQTAEKEIESLKKLKNIEDRNAKTNDHGMVNMPFNDPNSTKAGNGQKG